MRISLKAALVGSFSLLAAAAAIQGGISIVKLSSIDRDVRSIADNWLPSVGLLGDITTATRDERVKTYRYVAASDTDQLLADNEKSVRTSQAALTALRRAYEPLISSPEERALYDRFSATWATYGQRVEEIVTLMRAGRRSEALTLLAGPETLGLAQAATKVLQENLALNKQGARTNVDDAVGNAAAAATTAWIAMAVSLMAACLAALFGWLGVARPIERMTGAMGSLAAGDTTVAIPGRELRNEIGAMAAAVQVFKDNLLRTRALEEETRAARADAETQRRAARHAMADTFQRAVGGIVDGVTAAATELQATAQQLTATANQTAGQSGTVATAAQEAAGNVGTVAAAAEELGASVQEIGRQVDGSALLAQAAVDEAGQTATLVRDLSEAAARIGDVVALISTIAGQTNLLALNATIEAARAGAVLLLGDFQTQIVHNKELFRVLHRPETAALLTRQERRYIADHLPYTVEYTPDLAPRVIANKDSWILKPADSYGSRGVHAGVESTQEEWRAIVESTPAEGMLLQAFHLPFVSENYGFDAAGRFGRHRYYNLTGLYVYDGEPQGLYSRVSLTPIISSQYSEKTLPTLIVQD